MRALALAAFIVVACSPPAETAHHETPDAVQKCLRCHSVAGPGIEFNSATAPALAGLIAADVESGRMPPWVPSPESPAYAEDFSLSATEREQVARWARAGAVFDIKPKTPANAAVPDFVATMPAPYTPPPPPAGDEYRCFAVPAAGSVGSYRWHLGSPRATHHETALVISSAGLTAAQKREGADGRPGFDCITLPTEIEAVANLGAAGVTPGAVVSFPPGVGATVPDGGGFLVQMHYTGAGAAGDRSALELWRPSGPVRQMQLYALWAPVELPCPTGVSSDPRNRCSREYAISLSTIQTPDQVRAQADQLLAQCGTTLAAQQAQTPFAQSVPEHWYVPTSCEGALPFDGTAWQVHGHMHTQGATLRAELEVAGTWQPLLVIDKWRWAWEAAYTFEQPVKFKTGQRIRVRCTHDNGSKVQPSAVDGSPGYDGPAQLPLQETSYKVMGFARSNEMCEVFLGVTRD